MRIVVALAAGFALAALVIPALADSAPTRNTDAITLLQRRVTTLETRMRAVTAVLKSQSKINSIQERIDSRQDDQITNLQSQLANPVLPKLSVTSNPGTPVLITPRTWGYPTASCLSGTLIGAGYQTDYPIEVGSSRLNLSSWSLSVFNPNSNSTALVSAYAVCASLIP